MMTTTSEPEKYTPEEQKLLLDTYANVGMASVQALANSVHAAGGAPMHVLLVLENMVVAAIYTMDRRYQKPDGGIELLDQLHSAAAKRLNDLRLCDLPPQGHG